MTPLLDESLALRDRYDEEPSHSDHVAALALQIFDGLQSWHSFGMRARDLLHSASLLHDIGWSQTPDSRGHHKWSARLIREHDWKNLSAGEVLVVAQIARYHRKSIPAPEHEEFQALSVKEQKVVMVLGGILRLADALDRTHSGRIKRADAKVTLKALVVLVKPDGQWGAEQGMFETKRDMLELVAKRAVRVEELE